MWRSTLSRILTGQAVPLLLAPPLATLLSLVTVLSLGKLRSKPLYLALLRKLNIVLWLPPLVNFFGFNWFFRTLVYLILNLWSSTVIIKLLFTLPTIHFFMSAPEINCHLVREKLRAKVISISTAHFLLVNNLQTGRDQFHILLSKLGITDLHAPTWGGVLREWIPDSPPPSCHVYFILYCLYAITDISILYLPFSTHESWDFLNFVVFLFL